MDISDLKKVNGTLQRVTNFVESLEDRNVESLLIELDESKMCVEEDLVIKRAKELAEEAQSPDYSNFVSLAREEVAPHTL